MTELVFGSLLVFGFVWLAILHITTVSHKDELVDQSLRLRALQDHVNRIQKEVRGR